MRPDALTPSTVPPLSCRRVKQLGAGDVGLVDLVVLQGSEFKFAMKTLDKWEMQERNKVRSCRHEPPRFPSPFSVLRA